MVKMHYSASGCNGSLVQGYCDNVECREEMLDGYY